MIENKIVVYESVDDFNGDIYSTVESSAPQMNLNCWRVNQIIYGKKLVVVWEREISEDMLRARYINKKTPYYVVSCDYGYAVSHRETGVLPNHYYPSFNRAQAEANKLNEEWRKEQNNG